MTTVPLTQAQLNVLAGLDPQYAGRPASARLHSELEQELLAVGLYLDHISISDGHFGEIWNVTVRTHANRLHELRTAGTVEAVRVNLQVPGGSRGL